MKLRSLFVIMMSMAFCCLRAQEYSFTHYDINDGLAGSTVFSMLQDKQGFMWFGTETGVSRFDGSHFKNFSTFHGLPDNQILDLFEDSRGRIWMAPFNKSVCYYYKGVIYNQQNDSTLKKIKLSSHVLCFAEDKDGNILILQNSNFHLLKSNGNVVAIGELPSGGKPAFYAGGMGPGGKLHLLSHDQVFGIENDALVYKYDIKFPHKNYRYATIRSNKLIYGADYLEFMVIDDKSSRLLPYDQTGTLKFSVINDTLFSINTQTGTRIYNLIDGTERRFLPDEPVSYVLRDNEGNFWFSTLGHGVFMLNSTDIVNIKLRNHRGSPVGVYSLAKDKNTWLAGTDMVYIFRIAENKPKMAYAFLMDYFRPPRS